MNYAKAMDDEICWSEVPPDPAGNGAQKVFLCDEVYQRFIEQLDYCLEKNEVGSRKACRTSAGRICTVMAGMPVRPRRWQLN